MKKVIFILIALCMATSTFAETNIDKHPKRHKQSSGFNYAKHYRKQNRVKFFDRLFDRQNCNHYRQQGW